MTARETTGPRPDEAEDLLDDLLEQIGARLRRGEPVDVESHAARYPEHADRIRRVAAGVRAMVDLGLSTPDDPPGAPAEDRSPELGVLGDFRILREVGR